MICPSCGKQNRVRERSCCYCFASLSVDVDALFLTVLERGIDVSDLDLVESHVLDKKEDDGRHEEEELDILCDDLLIPIASRRDYTEIVGLCHQLIEIHDEHEERMLLRNIAREALRVGRGLGRVEPMTWGNKPLALVVQGIEDEDACSAMMELLEVPIFTARFLSSGTMLEVVRYAYLRADLEVLAVQYRHRFSARAMVVSQAKLQEDPPPLACLGLKGKAFRVVDEPLWREAITDFLEEELHIVVRLVVVGLVEEVRFRDVVRMEAASFGRRKKDRVRTKCMEKKVGVIDIHCDDVVIRIVEGVSDFSTFPGYEKGAQRKSFQNLCRLLHVWLEGAHVLPQRTLRVRTDSSEGMHVTAWADWERYSYCARSLFVFG